MKAVYLKFKEFGPYLMAGAAAWLAGIASNAMWETVGVWRSGSFGRFDWWNLGCIVVFSASVWLVYLLRRVFFKPRTRYLKDILNVPARQYLILFLSHLNPPYDQYENGIPRWLLLLSDPPDLIAE